MAKWVVLKTQRFVVDGAPDAITAIQATKDAKLFNYVVDVHASIADGYTGLSARTHVVNGGVEIKDPANVLDPAIPFVKHQVAGFSDGRLKEQYFHTLRDMTALTGNQLIGAEIYKEIIAKELAARELMDADGHIISVSNVRTPRKH